MQPPVKTSSEPRVYWLPYVAFVAVVKGYVPMDHLAAQPSQKKRAREEDDGEASGAPPAKTARSSDAHDASPNPAGPASGDGDLMEDD
jgi:hypothetical protein